MSRILAAAAAAASLTGLVACGGDERTAEAETNNTTVEVTTELSQNQVTDQQLNAVAEGAAIAAGTPQGSATGVVVAPPTNTTTP
jgi:uncharacterized protein with FMN-binding domain